MHMLLSRNKWYLVKKFHSWIPICDSWTCISAYLVILLNLKLPSWFISLFRVALALIHTHRNYSIFLCPFYVNPNGDWELPFCIEHSNCTCWRRWVGTGLVHYIWVGDSSLQASELPYAAIFSHTWHLFNDSWCPNSWCRYWCSWFSNKTFWFSACEYQPLSQQVICTIHPFKRRWNQLQLPVVYMCYSWWDNPISKIPPDHIQKPLSNQHII